MKNKFLKTLFVLLAIFTATVALSLSAFAESSPVADADEIIPISEGGSTEITKEDTENSTDEEGSTFFASLYVGAREHLGEIFCALTLVGSIFLAFAYKKGLLPVVTKALGAISSSVGKLGENTDTFTSKIEGESKRLVESLGLVQEKIVCFENALSRIEEELLAARVNGSMLEKTERTLEEQIEMLYELFMSSALPQYQKDAVAKKIADMRLRSEDCEG